MSLQARPSYTVPEETARVARAIDLYADFQKPEKAHVACREELAPTRWKSPE